MEDRGKTEGATAEFTSKQRDANVPGKLIKTTKGRRGLSVCVQMSAWLEVRCVRLWEND